MHNLHGQLSQYNYFIFSLNIDRDGASLISVGTKLHNWGAQSVIASRPIFTEFFLYLRFFGNALSYSLFCEFETYHQLAGQADCFQDYKFLSRRHWYLADE